jgi:hypothetical protein
MYKYRKNERNASLKKLRDSGLYTYQELGDMFHISEQRAVQIVKDELRNEKRLLKEKTDASTPKELPEPIEPSVFAKKYMHIPKE